MKDLTDTDLSRAARALEPDGAPQPGDQALVERLVSGALRAPSPMLWGRALLFATAAAVVIGGAVGANRMLGHAKLAETPADTRVAPTHVVELSPVTTVIATPAPVVAATPTPEAKPVVAPVLNPPLNAPAVASPTAPVTTLSAGELFKKANDTRHSDPTAAVGLYRELQTTFPSSPEARLSHVTLGRLYLDALGSPGEALPQFDAYLTSGDATFREDALIGRATALQKLGRRDDERQAWSTLLAEFPQSVAAGQAKSRSMP